MFLKDQFDALADEFISAIVSDLSDPEIRESVRYRVDQIASSLIGRDVNSPLIKPFWNKILEQGVEQIAPFVGIIKSDPPDSVEGTAEILKEEFNSKVDTMADKLKRRLAEKKEAKGV